MLDVIHFNLVSAFLFKKQTCKKFLNYTLRSMSFSDALRSIRIYKKVFPDRGYNVFRSVFLIFIARHFSFAVNKRNEVIGFEFCRFSREDIENGTVHESFIGVLTSDSGKGVASKLREFSSHVFEKNGLKGVSSRIVLSNIGSLKSARKLGFRVVKTYINDDGKEEAYLIKWFSQ